MSGVFSYMAYWYCADCAAGSDYALLGATDSEVEAARQEHNRLNHEATAPVHLSEEDN